MSIEYGHVIPTIHKGTQFRSRLEARWAVVFDELGIKWEYEPECFNLPSGKYLPDFRLPSLWSGVFSGGIWAEVKPMHPGGNEKERHAQLSNASNLPVLLLYSHVVSAGPFDVLYPADTDECLHYFCVCPTCLTSGFEFCGRHPRIRCKCPPKTDDFDLRSFGHPFIAQAFANARSAFGGKP